MMHATTTDEVNQFVKDVQAYPKATTSGKGAPGTGRSAAKAKGGNKGGGGGGGGKGGNNGGKGGGTKK
jgi:hypothetical protein